MMVGAKAETASVLEAYGAKFFTRLLVTIRFRDRVLAGIPKSGAMLDFYMESKHMSDAEKAEFVRRVQAGEVGKEELEEAKETSWCVFERDESGALCLWHGNLKALLRECFVALGLTQKRHSVRGKEDDKKVKAYTGGRQTLQHCVHVDPLRLLLLDKDGQVLKAATGTEDRVKHIQDASGRRSAIGRHEFVHGAVLKFVLKWPKDGAFSLEEIKQALALAQEDGLGACRSQGHGKFDVVAIEEL